MRLLITLPFLLLSLYINAQTVGTISYIADEIQEGYTLVSPLNYTSTYLMNNCGEVVHEWESSYPPGNEVFIDEEGRLWRAGKTPGTEVIGTGGRGGIIEVFSWEGDLIWSYELCNEDECMHHDFELLPNGNIAVLVWEAYSYDEAIALGADPETISTTSGVWSDYILEISPNFEEINSATVVWKWHAWDHMVQDFDEEKPNFGDVTDKHKINLNFVQFTQPDWLHANALDYNADLDQMIMSVPHFDEFWVVDHSLNTEDAATDLGDVLFRWGNTLAYGVGEEGEEQLHFQHNPHWVEGDLRFGGDIILFNNRVPHDEGFKSEVTVVSPVMNEDGSYAADDEQFLTGAPEYIYELPLDLYSVKVSGVQVLPNDNLLICSGSTATLHEINSEEEVVWEYKLPITGAGEVLEQGINPIDLKWMFRAYKYESSYSGFEGVDLVPGLPLELNSSQSFCALTSVEEASNETISVYPNPAEDKVYLNGDHNVEAVTLISMYGHIVREFKSLPKEVSLDGLNAGVYVFRIQLADGSVITKRVVKN